MGDLIQMNPISHSKSFVHYLNTTNQGRRLQNNYNNIRIHFDTSLLDNDPGWKCINENDVVTGATTGEPYTCSKNDLLTSSKKSFLLTTLIPAAKSYFTNRLSVIPIQDRLKLIPLSTCTTQGYACCANQMPTSLSSIGIDDTDLVIIVTARPTSGNTIAWAIPCQYDQYNRPIAGHINFGPSYLSTNVRNKDKIVGVAIHELTHVLGFSSNLYSMYRQSNNGPLWSLDNVRKSYSELGKTVQKIITPTVVAKVKQHYNCYDWPNAGMELEDSGGQGTAGSHWEKRIGHDEYMTGTAEQSPIYSAITLALFEDMGWYNVNYAYAEDFKWGKNAGCSFVKERCNAWGTNSPYFCSSIADDNHCTHDHLGYGYCSMFEYSSNLPDYYSYFSDAKLGGNDYLSDYCPYYRMYGNKHCRDKGTSSTTADSSYGEMISDSSLCFMGTYHLFTEEQIHSGCHQYRCINNRLQIKIGSSFVICPIEGGNVNVNLYNNEFQGYVVCPSYSEICAATELCPNSCSNHGSCSSLGTCSCTVGYEGTDCSSIVCPVGSNGEVCSGSIHTCDSTTGTCQCHAGYGGQACEENLCYSTDGRQCNGHGTCNTSTGTCVCDNGFTGAACDEAQCPNDCSNHGECYNTEGICICTIEDDGYYSGIDCSLHNTGSPYTLLQLSNNDLPSIHTGTVNNKEFKYYSVSIPSADYKIRGILTVLSGNPDIYASMVYTIPSQEHFTWLSTTDSNTDIIELDPFAETTQFTGPGELYISIYGYSQSSYTLEILRDPCSTEANICGDRGTCQFGECICDPGWSGARCSIPTCENNCNGRGTCAVEEATGIPACQCSNLWKGDDCSILNTLSGTLTVIPSYGSSYTNIVIPVNKWDFYSFEITSLNTIVYISFDRYAYKNAEALVFVKYNDIPTLNSYDFFDSLNWATKSNVNKIVIDQSQGLKIGTYYISIYCSTLSKVYLQYDMNVEIAEGECPPSLSSCSNHGNCAIRTEASCQCDTGYYGSDCSLQYTETKADTLTTMSPIKPGESFFTHVTVTQSNRVRIIYEQEEANDEVALLSVNLNTLPLITTENYIDYDNYINHSLKQTIELSGTSYSSSFYLGIHNNVNNKYSLKGTFIILPDIIMDTTNSTCDMTEVTCSNPLYSSTCHCRGACINDNNNYQCKCMQNWMDSTCNTPVLHSIQNLQYSINTMESIYSTYNTNTTLSRGTYLLFKLYQPLFLDTTLSISVTSMNGGNPDLFTSDVLPRTIYDFNNINSQVNTNETISTNKITEDGLIYVIIYANTDDEYNIQVSKQLATLEQENYDFIQNIADFANNTTIGLTLISITIIIIILILLTCCINILKSDKAKIRNIQKQMKKKDKKPKNVKGHLGIPTQSIELPNIHVDVDPTLSPKHSLPLETQSMNPIQSTIPSNLAMNMNASAPAILIGTSAAGGASAAIGIVGATTATTDTTGVATTTANASNINGINGAVDTTNTTAAIVVTPNEMMTSNPVILNSNEIPIIGPDMRQQMMTNTSITNMSPSMNMMNVSVVHMNNNDPLHSSNLSPIHFSNVELPNSIAPIITPLTQNSSIPLIVNSSYIEPIQPLSQSITPSYNSLSVPISSLQSINPIQNTINTPVAITVNTEIPTQTSYDNQLEEPTLIPITLSPTTSVPLSSLSIQTQTEPNMKNIINTSNSYTNSTPTINSQQPIIDINQISDLQQPVLTPIVVNIPYSTPVSSSTIPSNVVPIETSSTTPVYSQSTPSINMPTINNNMSSNPIISNENISYDISDIELPPLDDLINTIPLDGPNEFIQKNSQITK